MVSTRFWREGAVAVLVAIALCSPSSLSQETRSDARFSSWLPFQALPNITVTSYADYSALGFEWEATPLLYSFGMTSLISPWYSFIVELPARFTGSIELVTTGQFNTAKVGSSYFAGSVQLLGHIPLIERGEYLALNIGLARYFDGGSSPSYAVAGISTLFGILHVNVKRSLKPVGWMGSVEFRFF